MKGPLLIVWSSKVSAILFLGPSRLLHGKSTLFLLVPDSQAGQGKPYWFEKPLKQRNVHKCKKNRNNGSSSSEAASTCEVHEDWWAEAFCLLPSQLSVCSCHLSHWPCMMWCAVHHDIFSYIPVASHEMCLAFCLTAQCLWKWNLSDRGFPVAIENELALIKMLVKSTRLMHDDDDGNRGHVMAYILSRR